MGGRLVVDHTGAVLDVATIVTIGTPPEDFRKRWAGELARLVPPLESRDLEKVPLDGTIEPLVWDNGRRDAIRWVVVLFLVTALLFLWKWNQ